MKKSKKTAGQILDVCIEKSATVAGTVVGAITISGLKAYAAGVKGAHKAFVSTYVEAREAARKKAAEARASKVVVEVREWCWMYCGEVICSGFTSKTQARNVLDFQTNEDGNITLTDGDDDYCAYPVSEITISSRPKILS